MVAWTGVTEALPLLLEGGEMLINGQEEEAGGAGTCSLQEVREECLEDPLLQDIVGRRSQY